MIEIDGLYRTRDGKPVRLLRIDGDGRLCVHGIVTWSAIGDQEEKWTIDGFQLDATFPTDEDLVPIGEVETLSLPPLTAEQESLEAES